MKTPNRDLLVLVKDNHLNKDAIEFELEQLNQLLLVFESMDNLCMAHEIFDLNKYKIIHKHGLVRQVMNQKELKPFVFISNKN
jgi:N-acetylglucosamine-6-phosphate deacetylase